MDKTNESIFDQFHNWILSNWRTLVWIACITVLFVAGNSVRSYFNTKFESEQSELYNTYVSANRKQQEEIAQNMLKNRHSNYHVLIALWETKNHFDAANYTDAKKWLQWASEHNDNKILGDLINYRMLNLCYQTNDHSCIEETSQKLVKTAYAPLALFIEAQNNVTQHNNNAAISQLEQAIAKTDDKMLKLIFSTNIMALK